MRSTQFELVAAASRNARVDGIANYPDLASMLGSRPELDCIAICTPPQAHFAAAVLALDTGKHVLLEKPPAATTREIALLAAQAAKRGAHPVPDLAFTFRRAESPRRGHGCATRRLRSASIVWKEDVRVWHPG